LTNKLSKNGVAQKLQTLVRSQTMLSAAGMGERRDQQRLALKFVTDPPLAPVQFRQLRRGGFGTCQLGHGKACIVLGKNRLGQPHVPLTHASVSVNSPASGRPWRLRYPCRVIAPDSTDLAPEFDSQEY